MRIAVIPICLICSGGLASAQTQPPSKPGDTSGYSSGSTVSHETRGQEQPQGWTGPIDTGSGGAPAESPQGESPPGMQSAPEGSSKAIASPKE